MMKRAQLQILLHGLIVLLVGLLCGLPYGQAITQAWGENAVRAWRFAHLGLIVVGMWLLVVAGVSRLLVLSHWNLGLLVYSIVTSAYGFTVALVVAAVGDVRGLEAEGPVLNMVAFLANSVAALASLVWVVLMIIGTTAALRETDAR
jgi:hypothetical protein